MNHIITRKLTCLYTYCIIYMLIIYIILYKYINKIQQTFTKLIVGFR